MPWKPDNAPLPLEQEMERMDLPESDRHELRRFAEVLARRKQKRAGAVLPPVPAGMLEWLRGE